MAAGDALLDTAGNVLLDTSGNARLKNVSNECSDCCEPDCPICEELFPDEVDVTIADVISCTCLILLGSGCTETMHNLTGQNGTWAVPRVSTTATGASYELPIAATWELESSGNACNFDGEPCHMQFDGILKVELRCVGGVLRVGRVTIDQDSCTEDILPPDICDTCDERCSFHGNVGGWTTEDNAPSHYSRGETIPGIGPCSDPPCSACGSPLSSFRSVGRDGSAVVTWEDKECADLNPAELLLCEECQ